MPTPPPTQPYLEQPPSPRRGGSGSASGESLPRWVAGRYLLQSVIARGGMGVVYRAFDQRLEREVALKQMLPRSEPDERARFAREARIAAGLDHPNIVAVHDCGLDDGLPFLVMDLIEGVSLEQAARSEPLDPRAAAEVIRVLALALESAHARGVLHRDLKPANVLLKDGVTPLLTDFGLADRAQDERITISGTLLGTPAYMAPEQARALELDERTDVYGLGGCLYRILGGAPPHETGSITATLLAVLESDPAPLLTLRPDLDPTLAAICHRCLEKDPDRRYPSAAALADDLTRWLAGEAVALQQPAEPGPGRTRLRVALAVLCAVALALTALAAARNADARRAVSEQEASSGSTAHAFLQRGLARHAAGQWLEAERLYDQGLALTRDPGERAALLARRGDARGERGARSLQIEDYTASLKLAPDQARVLEARGAAHTDLGRIDPAIADLTRAIELSPRAVSLWVLRAEAKLVVSRGPEALDDLEQAASLSPQRVEQWRRIAVLRFKAGDVEGGVAAIERAVAIARTPAEIVEARTYRGILQSKRRRFDEALADLEAALELDPGYLLALSNRLHIRLAQRRLDLALSEATHLVDTVAPGSADALFLRAKVHFRRGDRTRATRDLREALRLDPKHVPSLNRRAALKEEAGDYAGAMADYRRLGVLLGPRAKSEQAQIREKLRKLERLRAGGRR